MINFLVDNNIATSLKEIGFEDECMFYFTTYNDNPKGLRKSYNYDCQNKKELTLIPFRNQVIKWFREEFGLHPYIVPYGDGESWNIVNIGRCDKLSTTMDFYDRLDYDTRNYFSEIKFNSYEEAEIGAINKLIETNNSNECICENLL